MSCRFQPTLPARGATTPSLPTTRQSKAFQPTLPARGATKAADRARIAAAKFQPTLPARGATDALANLSRFAQISTHAPRTGSDSGCQTRAPADFISTHAPRTGSDPPRRLRGQKEVIFQPTLPARGATGKSGILSSPTDISTHAPRTGSDNCTAPGPPRRGHFNPRSPHGERPDSTARRANAHYFNPRSPHGERRRFHRIRKE